MTQPATVDLLQDPDVLDQIGRLVGAACGAALDHGLAVKSLAVVVHLADGTTTRQECAAAGCDCRDCLSAMAAALKDMADQATPSNRLN